VDPLILNLVQGVLSLCACGGSHEIERDEDLCAGMDLLDETEIVEDGIILKLENGDRYKVTVTKL
jgi:hypothetical protein